MQNNDKLLVLVLVGAIVGILSYIVIGVLVILGAIKIGNDCFMRYNMEGFGSELLTQKISVSASGKYDSQDSNFGKWINSNFLVQGGRYDAETKEQEITFNVKGEVSLCKAYLPKNTTTCKLTPETCDISKFFEDGSGGCKEDCEDNTDIEKKKIPIPNINDLGRGIPLVVRASAGEWRNVAYLLAGDKVEVQISPNRHPSFVPDITNVSEEYTYSSVRGGIFSDQDSDAKRKLILADCTEGKKKYSAICGRYCPWGDGDSYTSKCEDCKNCSCEECGIDPEKNKKQCLKRYCPEGKKDKRGACATYNDALLCRTTCTYESSCGKFACSGDNAWEEKPIPMDCVKTITANLPDAYWDDGRNTVPDISPTTTLVKSEVAKIESDIASLKKIDCSQGDRATVDNRSSVYSWRSASYGTDLKYRFSEDGSINSSLGSMCGDSSAEFATSCYKDVSVVTENTSSKGVILKANVPNTQEGGKGKLYLQYMIPPNQITDTSSNSTGGYVLYLKQDSCVREDGLGFDDAEFAARGKLSYVILPSGQDPNTAASSSYTVHELDVKVSSANAGGVQKIKTNEEGYVWLRINNKADDYQYSSGSYEVTISSSTVNGQFLIKVLNPIIKLLKGTLTSVSKKMFQNMTCYQSSNSSECTNFFNYIRAILTLYVLSYGFMFLIGVTKISVNDLVIRVVKITIVAGLLNEKTFDYFNFYFYDGIIGFTDQMISNFSGYTAAQAGSVTNPFSFLDSLMSRIFFTKTFLVQVLSLLSMGLVGILYFTMIFVALVILVVTLLKTMAVYILALTAVSLLIGLAPIFLVFMLFDYTWYLFDNWCRHLLRYLVEPVILLAGIVVLTQMFTIYLDYVLGYSACWKCVAPFKIPLHSIPGLSGYGDLELFCIHWFAPWGYDSRSGTMGLDMTRIAALLIIVYCMHGYLELSDQIVNRLFSGTSSATGMASPISRGLDNLLPNYQNAKNLFSRFNNRNGGGRESVNAGGSSNRSGIRGDLDRRTNNLDAELQDNAQENRGRVAPNSEEENANDRISGR